MISNQRPSSTVEFKHTEKEKKSTIGFSDDGICDACHYNDVKANQIDWELRDKNLLATLDKFRSKDGSYDVIVPGSGGKDSVHISYIKI